MFLVALGASVARPNVAVAQTPSADPVVLNREAARALAERGLDMTAAGKHAEALDLFEQAEARFHAPTHLLFAARALEKLGRLASAEARYQRVVDEKLPDYASDVFRNAQASARSELEILKPRVPRLTLVVTGAPKLATLTIDGHAADATAHQLAIDPGHHALVATVPAGMSLSRTVDAKENDRLEVRFAFEAPSQPPPITPPPIVDAPSRGSLLPGIIAAGIGVAAAGVGTAFGVLSKSRVDDLAQRCPTKKNCDPADQHLADDARSFGTASTVGFVLAGVGVAAGVVLIVVRPGGSKPKASGFVPHVDVVATPRGLAIDGVF